MARIESQGPKKWKREAREKSELERERDKDAVLLALMMEGGAMS